jgi:phosphoglucomutase
VLNQEKKEVSRENSDENKTMKISPFAGLLPVPSDLVDVDKLFHAFEQNQPDHTIPSQRVHFGTSGHRGSSFDVSFNRNHVLAISQSICHYRKKKGITGPLFLGYDTHALSLPAFQTTLEVLAGNDVTVMIAKIQEFTPTPVISHAILNYNRGRKEGFADGIVITPSHNPPQEGGFKYNPPHGGPAEKEITDWIQDLANGFLRDSLNGVRQVPLTQALKCSSTHYFDFLNPYVRDLGNIIDKDIIRESKIKMGVDPMGGAGVHYWQPIADYYKIDLTVLNTEVDPTFRFMTRDWDGQIRMDPSSQYAMKSLLKKSQDFDISFACDTDHDRHGIVTKKAGLIPPNHFLSSMIYYLFKHRLQWNSNLKIGKTLVSSQMIDRVAQNVNRELYEVPVGFKWFVEGILSEELGFVGEESAGATFLRKNGTIWTTDKDGFIPSLLSAEMTARTGQDPAVLYQELAKFLGNPSYCRVEVPADSKLREAIKNFSVDQISLKNLAGDGIEKILEKAPGNKASIGGVKIETKNGWMAIRPSGTEDIYKIYAESFLGKEHLKRIIEEGQQLVDKLISRQEAICPDGQAINS